MDDLTKPVQSRSIEGSIKKPLFPLLIAAIAVLITGSVVAMWQIAEKKPKSRDDIALLKQELETLRNQRNAALYQAITKYNDRRNIIIDTDSSSGKMRYISSHGFQVSLPSTWSLDSAIETRDSIEDAQTGGGNVFSIYNFDLLEGQERRHTVWTKDIVAIHVYLSDLSAPNYQGPRDVDEWLKNVKEIGSDLIRFQDIKIDGKRAILIMQDLSEANPKETKTSVHFIDPGKQMRAEFQLFTRADDPEAFVPEFLDIVQSFSFSTPPELEER